MPISSQDIEITEGKLEDFLKPYLVAYDWERELGDPEFDAIVAPEALARFLSKRLAKVGRRGTLEMC